MTGWAFCPSAMTSLQASLTGFRKAFSLNSLLGLCLVMKVVWGGGRWGGGLKHLTDRKHASNSQAPRSLHRGL